MPTPTSIASVGCPWNQAPATTPITTVYSDQVTAPTAVTAVKRRRG